MNRILKKTIAIIISVITACFVMLEAQAAQVELEDVVLSQEQFNEILSNVHSTDSVARSSSLITEYGVGAAKDGSKIIITAKTVCATSVTKCGLKELVVQRRVSDQYEWSDYLVYEDLYADTYTHALSKSVTVTSGYQYRVTAVHYAKKSLLSTEKAESTSNIVWI
ncbi:MAG: hypothetical protein IJ491_04745 [Clostridia bacterium]|nr:hypothetical protein [Clostridia bacterium]